MESPPEEAQKKKQGITWDSPTTVLNSSYKQYNISLKIIRSDIHMSSHYYPLRWGMFHCFAGTKKISLFPWKAWVIPKKKTKNLLKKNATPAMVNGPHLKKPQAFDPPTKIPINAQRKAEM
jgi:hypothetical protein